MKMYLPNGGKMPQATTGLSALRNDAKIPSRENEHSLSSVQDPMPTATSASYDLQRAARPTNHLGQSPRLDSSAILSRMVTASSGTGTGGVPIRVASAQDFRRSMNSLRTVPELPKRAMAPSPVVPLQTGSTMFHGNRPMSSDNPLLEMMERRMAANAAADAEKRPAMPKRSVWLSPLSSLVNGENKKDLQSSIDQQTGIKNITPTAQEEHSDGNTTKPSDGPAQTFGPGPISGRASPSPSQIEMLDELTALQRIGSGMQPLQKKNLQQFFLKRASGKPSNAQLTSGVGPNRLTNDQLPPASIHSSNKDHLVHHLKIQPSTPQATQTRVQSSAFPNLNRCAVSLSEIDQFGSGYHSTQLRQQLQGLISTKMGMQERAMQQQLNGQTHMDRRNIAATALLCMHNDGSQCVAQDDLGEVAVKEPPSQELQKSGGMTRSKSTNSLRKRRSLANLEDSVGCDSQDSISSQSMTSSTSSYKIHRSLSRCSARATLVGSMGDLRVNSLSGKLSGSMSNQSFSSGLKSARSHLSLRLNTKNQNFSFGLNPKSPIQHEALPDPMWREQDSSNNWIKSLVSSESSAGKATAAVESPCLSSSQNEASSLVQQEGVIWPKSMQVEATSRDHVPVGAPSSTVAETVFTPSTAPNKSKSQNPQASMKPLDVVKEALSSRGLKCDTKPSMKMEDTFFLKVTEMYNHELVKAIRSDDVNTLRTMYASGTNLQCGNKFGETLVHLACRRSCRDTVSFLVDEAGIWLRVRDDFGRTPMHDACWRAELDLDLLDFLIDRVPELLLLYDKRGDTPLDYSRREHWPALVTFLAERASKFRPV